MADPTSGFQLTDMPHDVSFTPNAGVFDPSQVVGNANQSLDYFTKLKNWGANELATQSALAAQSAGNLSSIAQTPSATDAGIARNIASRDISTQTTPGYIGATNATNKAASDIAEQTTSAYIDALNNQHKADVITAYKRGMEDAKAGLTAAGGIPTATATGEATGSAGLKTAQAGDVAASGALARAPIANTAAAAAAQNQLASVNIWRPALGLNPIDIPSVSDGNQMPAGTGPLSNATVNGAGPAAGAPLGIDPTTGQPTTEADMNTPAQPAGAPAAPAGPAAGAVIPGAPAGTQGSGAPPIVRFRTGDGNTQITAVPDPSKPEGMSVNTQPVPPEVRTAELAAQSRVVAVNLDPAQYKNPDGSYNIPAADAAVIAKVGMPQIGAPNNADAAKGVPALTPNPAANLPADKALEVSQKQKQESSDLINKEIEPTAQNIQNAMGSVVKIISTNKDVTTGALTGSQIGQAIQQAESEAEAMATGSPRPAASGNRAIDALSQSLVPYARDKTLNRILAAETPWLNQAVPSIKNTKDVNTIIANHLTARLQDQLDNANYLVNFQAAKGTLMGAEAGWRGYRQANPVFDKDTGNPVTGNETPAQYFTRVADHPEERGLPPGKASQLLNQSKNPAPGAQTNNVDLTRKYTATEIAALPSTVQVQGTNGKWYYGQQKPQ